MKIIIGLGNPGAEYQGTRHNVGFAAVQALAEEANLSFAKERFKSQIAEGFVAGQKVLLAKPQTYMNLSGEAVVQILNFYKVDLTDVLIVFDDVSLPVGSIRLRTQGSAGGQNGMKNIIALTGTSKINRLRIGVGAPRGNLVSHVLGKFQEEEAADYEKGQKLALEAMKSFIREDMAKTMNRYNVSVKKEKTKGKKERNQENPEGEESRKTAQGEAGQREDNDKEKGGGRNAPGSC